MVKLKKERKKERQIGLYPCGGGWRPIFQEKCNAGINDLAWKING